MIFEGAVTVEGIGGYPRSIIISAPMTLAKSLEGSNYTDSSHFYKNSYLKIEVNYLGKTYELYPTATSYVYNDVKINLSPTEEPKMLKGRVDISVKCSLHIEATESGNTVEQFMVTKGSWSVKVPKTTCLVAAE